MYPDPKPVFINRIALLWLALAVCLVASAVAQRGIDVEGAIRTGAWKPYKIAIDDFSVVGAWSAEADSLARLVQKVITDDLDFHIFFDTIPKSEFYLQVWEVTQLTPQIWFRMGADYLITGEVELEGQDIKIYYTISELNPRIQTLKTEKLKTRTFNYRRIAHMVSDAAVEHIAAEKGIFTTRLVYVSLASGFKELWVCDYDGANAMQITDDRHLSLSPDWDRKEDKVLYTTYRRGTQEVWERDIRSGTSKPISTYPNSNNAARISPDNKEILISLSKDGNAELYVLDRKGKIKRRLTNIGSIEAGASWSPTGNEIAFSSDRTGQPQIYVMDAEGFGVTRLTYQGRYNDSPDFSPRGTTIAFVSRGDDGKFQICTIDVTGQYFARLDQTGSNENPRWSPDGWHLVYAKHQGRESDLYIMDRFKQRVRRITFDGKSSNPAWQPFGN